jgi:hypothetical protein
LDTTFLYYNQSNEIWFKFTGDTSDVGLSLSLNSDTSARIQRITFYSGTCSGMTQIGQQSYTNQDTLYYFAENISQGQDYFFKIEKFTTAPCASCNFYFSCNLSIADNIAPPPSTDNLCSYILCPDYPNLITNGQFDDPGTLGVPALPPNEPIIGVPTGFISNYSYVYFQYIKHDRITVYPDVTLPPAPNIPVPNPYWVGQGLQGNTANSNFLICDGSTKYGQVTPPYVYKSDPIAVVHGQTYFFSFKLMNLVDPTLLPLGPPPQPALSDFRIPIVQLEINNVVQQFNNLNNASEVKVSYNPGNWIEVCGVWNNTVSDFANLKIRIKNLGATVYGNDLGIDDIIFKKILPNLTIVMDDVVHCRYSDCNLLNPTITGGTPQYSYLWSTGETSATICVSPWNTTVYTLTVVDENGCTAIKSVTVTAQDPPMEPEITGPNDLCETNYSYTLTNTANLYVNISINSNAQNIPYGSINSGGPTLSGNSISFFNVTWNTTLFNMEDFATITIVVTDLQGCSTTRTFSVYFCCDWLTTPPAIDLRNPILTSNTSYTSGSYHLHGTMHIMANVIIEKSEFRMNPDAKIVIYPNSSLNIIDNSNLFYTEGCNRMWDGIYLKDPTSSLLIDGSTIEDALNAVVSKNNGQITITNSSFNNNYIGVIVKDYYNGNLGYIPNTPYNCDIQNTIFRCSNTNNYKLAKRPYIGEPIHCGIKIENVNSIIIGELGTLTPNTISHMRYGMIAPTSL